MTQDSLSETKTAADTVMQVKEKKSFFNKIYKIVKAFSQVDTNYIEPQRYNFTVMIQNTNTYEQYTIKDGEGQSVSFSPKPSFKIGPYVGWRFVFLGYTLDIKHMSLKSKQELDLSLYSAQLGFDIYYRKIGDNYRIADIYLGKNEQLKPMHNVPFDGISGSIKGFNLYYILNHKKFSYPAAFSQSTIQRRSVGSPMIGIGYAKQSLNIDWAKLESIVQERCGDDVKARLDSTLQRGRVSYSDAVVSGGYGYNWVFARNWLFDISLSLGLSYKRTTSDSEHSKFTLREFSLNNINLDGIGRIGLVWNNMRWYAGTSAVFHSYYYKKGQFSTNTMFGNVNIYVGFNFGKR